MRPRETIYRLHLIIFPMAWWRDLSAFGKRPVKYIYSTRSFFFFFSHHYGKKKPGIYGFTLNAERLFASVRMCFFSSAINGFIFSTFRGFTQNRWRWRKPKECCDSQKQINADFLDLKTVFTPIFSPGIQRY